MLTLDLFCGAGGITEGFRQAGFTCLYGNDVNEWAAKTFSLNHPNALTDSRAIESIKPMDIRRQLKLRAGDLDVLVGGPPCQGFSINAPERFLDDPRNKLFKNYLAFIDEFNPKTFLFENVPGMLSLGKGAVFRKIIAEMAKRDYHITAKILFAPHYGVPQERWRLFILGSKLGESLIHPAPRYFAKGRANFTGGNTMRIKLEDSERDSLLHHVTVSEAIGDLPKLEMGEGDERVEYPGRKCSAYAKSLRNSSGFTFNHYAAKLAKVNNDRLKFIKPGGSWRDIPHELLPLGMQRARRSDHTKRYGRLHPNGLSSTIMTKCDPHWGPVFHPDQHRSLTVREAARFQSFPDSYQFLGPRVAQYEQVGNAVPVLLAKAIAQVIAVGLAPKRFASRGG